MVAFLVPHGVTPNRAVKVYQAFGKETMDILRRHPYRLCEAAGIGFLTADQIARSLGLDPRSPERMDAALLHTLQEAEQRGHLCLEKHDFLLPVPKAAAYRGPDRSHGRGAGRTPGGRE